jgi:amino acid permease
MKKFWLIISLLIIDTLIVLSLILSSIFYKEVPNQSIDDLSTMFIISSFGVIYELLKKNKKDDGNN